MEFYLHECFFYYFSIMIRPEYLKPGDIVGLVAPSRWVTEAEIAPFLKILSGWGLKYRLAENLYIKDYQLAGDKNKRVSGLVTMLNDPEVKAVFNVRGGYGAIHLLDELSRIDSPRSKLRGIIDPLYKFLIALANPAASYGECARRIQSSGPLKWIIGFSDITFLHFYFQSKLNCQSLHAAMPYQSGTGEGIYPESIESMRKALFGEPLEYAFPGHDLNVPGKASGMLIGGNLSVICSLSGTEYIPETDHLILFLEDVDEYLYHIDRMMYNLKLTGLLNKIRGLIIGGMNRMHDNEIPFGKDAYQIIRDIVSEYQYPVCFGFAAGHQEPNLALIMGGEVELDVNIDYCQLKFKNND